ncbi:ATPase [Amylibacter marinus]|uniref:ATPase n=1 Tax=Amylibacter marinus TaxID=1475483 RepID=A0ABQ5VXL8_9RHOB|nr:division plane positioning ATPase MipZ [Amylibacter marinus]GLQ35884.1 ATPase [Amylibacter marinus]
MSHLIVFGNEKGGAGKSTLSMHVACALLQSGKRVGVLDLDLRQLSLQRFFENRAAHSAAQNLALPMAQIGELDLTKTGENWEADEFATRIAALKEQNDFVLIDCPGALTRFSELAHAASDTLVTPMNDSFIDFDLLARLDGETNQVKGPSIYSEMVWDARKARSLARGKPIDWVVARNRLASQNMHNKRKVAEALDNLSKRIGFRLCPGLSDRVVFKELFPRGLTVADPQSATKLASSLSNVAARQELRDLMTELNLADFSLGF